MSDPQRPATQAIYRFGPFELQPAAQRLLVSGEAAILGPRSFDLLVALVERAGQLISKKDLLEAVWPGLVIEENNLPVQVSTLRKILGADAITTVAGRGYRFTLPLESHPAPLHFPSRARGSSRYGMTTPSIAVLPFVNISDSVANEYFADGLTEELINVLSKIGGLHVASRTSTFVFKGTNRDIPTVAAKLNVAAILEGSVRAAGSRVRVTAQLVNAETDSHLWSETYDRKLGDIFTVQDDIAHSVVKEMHSSLMRRPLSASVGAQLRAEVQAAVTGRSKDAEAYRLYLQGSFFMKRYSAEDLAKAVGFFQGAVRLDPEYALAWASLAACYLYQSAYHWAPVVSSVQRARKAAQRALEAGPEVAAGHWAMSRVLMYHDWDWPGAEASIRRALQLAPNDSQLCARAVALMQSLGRLEEAEELAARAQALDPLNLRAYIAAGRQFTIEGRLADAEHCFQQALEIGPRPERIHTYLGRVHLLQGRLDEALREITQETTEVFRLQGIACVQHANGHAAEAKKALRQLVMRYADDAAFQIAKVHGYWGDADCAFEWLERAYLQRDPDLVSVGKNSCLLQNLQDDRRWQPFFDRMGLPDGSRSTGRHITD